MLHKIFAWLGVVEHKSFDHITSGLKKMEDELRSLAAHHGLKTVEKNAAVHQLHVEINAHIDEAAKASAAATKIGALLG